MERWSVVEGGAYAPSYSSGTFHLFSIGNVWNDFGKGHRMANHKHTQKPPKPDGKITSDLSTDTTARAPLWQATQGMYLAGRAAIDEADALAVELERTWGVGRLRLLVDTALRERFDRQRALFNSAIWHGDLERVRDQSARMCKGWRALNAAATAAGSAPLAPTVWEAATPDGEVIVVVRDNADAHAALADGRALTVYTMAEVARLLAAFPEIAKIKARFEGATVEAARHIADPLDALPATNAKLDDPLPI